MLKYYSAQSGTTLAPELIPSSIDNQGMPGEMLHILHRYMKNNNYLKQSQITNPWHMSTMRHVTLPCYKAKYE